MDKDLAVTLDGVNGNRKARLKSVRNLAALRVECPGESAVIGRPFYTFHIAAAPGTGVVEVSIDQGGWMPCCEALGLWWYDWSGYEIGDYEVSARVAMGDGVAVVSAPRLFTVE